MNCLLTYNIMLQLEHYYVIHLKVNSTILQTVQTPTILNIDDNFFFFDFAIECSLFLKLKY